MKNLAMLIICVATITGCASRNLEAPCPNFGAHCDKTPINSWRPEE